MIPMTFAQWAESEPDRMELAKALSLPIIQKALATLREANRPSAKIPEPVAGLEPVTALALVNVQRAGGHNMLDALMNLPLLRRNALQAFSDPSMRSNPPPEEEPSAKKKARKH